MSGVCFRSRGKDETEKGGGERKGEREKLSDDLKLKQAWATSGPRATYGPPSTLMWPASYI